MIRAIDMGWYVLDKYYNKTGEAPVYAAAILLDLRKRAAYLYRTGQKSGWSLPLNSPIQYG